MKFYAYRNGVKGVEKHCFTSWEANLIKEKKELNGPEKIKEVQMVC